MKIKQPLTPADVPLLCWMKYIINGDQEQTTLVTAIFNHGVRARDHLLNFKDMAEDGTMFSTDRKNWQPCYKEVEEFNPADYRPGQIVDVATAKRLHEEKVSLQVKLDNGHWRQLNPIEYIELCEDGCGHTYRIHLPPPGELTAEEAREAFERGEKVEVDIGGCGIWEDVVHLFYSGGPSCRENRYRLKPAPRVRDIRLDELPGEFIWHDHRCLKWVMNARVSQGWITERYKKTERWSYDVRGPWREFTVEEEGK